MKLKTISQVFIARWARHILVGRLCLCLHSNYFINLPFERVYFGDLIDKSREWMANKKKIIIFNGDKVHTFLF